MKVWLASFILVVIVICGDCFSSSLATRQSVSHTRQKVKSGCSLCSLSTVKPVGKPPVNGVEPNNGMQYRICNQFPYRKTLYDRFSFNWVKSLMEAGNKKTLGLSDIWLLNENQRMENASIEFERLFELESAKPSPPTTERTNILLQYWQSPITRVLFQMWAFWHPLN